MNKNDFNRPIDYSDKTILIVEDSDFCYLYLSEVLCSTNAIVIRASTGMSAIDISRNTPTIDLIFMDLKLPDISGFKAAQIIKSVFPNIAIIACSACAMTDIADKYLISEFDDFLLKPIDRLSVIRTLEKHIYSKSSKNIPLHVSRYSEVN